jgi:hypothetical protein
MCFRQRCTTDFRQNAPLFCVRNAIVMMELLSRTLGVGAGQPQARSRRRDLRTRQGGSHDSATWEPA